YPVEVTTHRAVRRQAHRVRTSIVLCRRFPKVSRQTRQTYRQGPCYIIDDTSIFRFSSEWEAIAIMRGGKPPDAGVPGPENVMGKPQRISFNKTPTMATAGPRHCWERTSILLGFSLRSRLFSHLRQKFESFPPLPKYHSQNWGELLRIWLPNSETGGSNE